MRHGASHRAARLASRRLRRPRPLGCTTRAAGGHSGRSQEGEGMARIFFVPGLHGSEFCWKKSLTAGSFYGADVVILGGDVTGKAMVPIVQQANGSWEASLQDFRETL